MAGKYGTGSAGIIRRAMLRRVGATHSEMVDAILDWKPSYGRGKAGQRVHTIIKDMRNNPRFDVIMNGVTYTAVDMDSSLPLVREQKRPPKRHKGTSLSVTSVPSDPALDQAKAGFTDEELQELYVAARESFERDQGATISEAKEAILSRARDFGKGRLSWGHASAFAQEMVGVLSADENFSVRKEREAGRQWWRYWVSLAEEDSDDVDDDPWDAPMPEPPAPDPFPEPTIKKIARQDRDGFILPDWYPFLKDAIERDQVILIVGPTGCGKSELCRIAADDLDLVFERFNFNGETTTDHCIGYTTLVKGETKFKPGIIPQSMENGELLLLDELDAATPEVLFFMHRLMEKPLKGGRTLLIPDAPEDEETHEADEDFRLVAAANTTGRGDEAGLYQGTNILNEAFLNRFGKIFHMEYAPNEQEILKGRTKCDDRYADLLARFARDIRVFIANSRLPITISTRDLISMAEVVDAWGIKMAVELSWFNRVGHEFQSNITGSAPWMTLMGAA